MSNLVKLFGCFLIVCLMVACPSSAFADLMIDDFAAPVAVVVPIINLLDPDPTLIETVDVGIAGEERDILLDVVGTSSFSSFIGEIGGGSFKFAGASPGTAATIQYDGDDADTAGPPAALVNSEGLGGIDLTAFGSMFGLEFSNVDGGGALVTGIEIEVHSSSSTATLSDLIADSEVSTTFHAPFSSFSDPGVFTGVTSIEFRINPGSVDDVDFQLATISVVPEPSMLGLLAGGLIAMLGYAWRRRRPA